MTVTQFFGTITKPIEYVWDKIRGIEHRFEKVIRDEEAITPEFVAAAKQFIVVGEQAFQAVTLAAKQRGENWIEDLAAKAAVEAFLPAFKDFSVEVSKSFGILETDLDGNDDETTVDEASEGDDSSTTAAADQVQQTNQEANHEEQREENADATLTAAENEAKAQANTEEDHQ